jgi:SDR family mycofactocin-dependent oxidoreductase
MGTLDGKVAFITGAARGQGRSHAIVLAEQGASIIAVDACKRVSEEAYDPATPADLAETVKLVEDLDGRILAREIDVRDPAGLREIARDGAAEFGGLDIVVANAGVTTWSGMLDISEDLWQDTIDINLTGVFNTIKATAPIMIEHGRGGSIVITSSVAGLKALPGLTHYSASKHGLVGLMKGAAIELAQHHIRVNTVHPWGVDTHMGTTPPIAQKLFEENPQYMDSFKQLLHKPSIATPRDISETVLFLASDASRLITGVALPVDAGATKV